MLPIVAKKLAKRLAIKLPIVANNGKSPCAEGTAVGVAAAMGSKKGFDDRLLFENVTFALPRGGIVGIIGPNGAGKTTLFRMRWAALDPVARAKMAKTRPVVIVSVDVLNERLQTVTICPLTSQLHPGWRTRLTVHIGRRDAAVAVDQIRTVSKSRLGAKLGALSESEARTLRRGIGV